MKDLNVSWKSINILEEAILFFGWCYTLNCVTTKKNSYVEILSPKVMEFGNGFWEMMDLDEVLRMGLMPLKKIYQSFDN